MVRALVIAISALLILLLMAAGSAWYLLHDEAFLKRQLEDAVQRETGRALSIDGALVVEMGESIRVSADGLRFADAAWTKRDAMIEVGRITAQMDTRSLFSERLEIDFLSLSNCRLTLETTAAGERNWVFGRDSEQDDSVDQTLAGFPVMLGRLDLENCELEHLAPERTESLQLMIGKLALQADEQGQYFGDAAGLVNATEFRFAGRFGPPEALWQCGEFVQEVDLALGEITLTSTGSFADARTGEGAALSLRFSGPEFLQVASYLNLPPFSSGPFDATARIDTTHQTTLLSIDGDLGTLDVKADG